MDVSTAVQVPVSLMPLVDRTDFITIEDAIVYNETGMAVAWNFVTTAGVMTTTAITPTTGDDHDWLEEGTDKGMYSIEIPAASGDANNDTVGFGWITGETSSTLPFRGPTIGFRAAALNNALIDGGDLLDVNVTNVADTAQTAGDLAALITTVDTVVDAIPTTAMRGTDSAATAANLATLTNAAVLTSATIETVTSQTQFVIPAPADATDDNAYNSATAVFIDGTDPNQKSIRLVTDYAASTRTITVQTAPDFTITTSDTLTILSAAYVDGVIDEVLTGATHNITNSLGRRIRQAQELGRYVLGSVSIDTVNGTAGTEKHQNGVDINPVKSIADANTIASDPDLNLTRFIVTAGSSITFAVAQENQDFIGRNYAIALGGQSVSGSHFEGANISGTGTGASEIHFEHCEVGTTTIAGAHFDDCDITGVITLSAAGTYVFINCAHGGASPVIDFGSAVGNTTVHVHGWFGALEIRNMGQASSTDVLHFDSPGGQLTLASTCIAGTVNFRGTAALVNNGSGQTINRGGDVVNDVATILTSQMTESYAANGVAPTAAQALFAIHQALMDFSISGTTLTAEQLDGTTAFLVTLDDKINPTSANRN